MWVQGCAVQPGVAAPLVGVLDVVLFAGSGSGGWGWWVVERQAAAGVRRGGGAVVFGGGGVCRVGVSAWWAVDAGAVGQLQGEVVGVAEDVGVAAVFELVVVGAPEGEIDQI